MTEYQPGDIQPGPDGAPQSRREARKAEADAQALRNSAALNPLFPESSAAESAAAESGADEPENIELGAVEPGETSPGASGPTKRGVGTRIVGVAGELLITGGVLVLLFLGWQLWWNSIVLTNEQASDATSLANDWKVTVPTGSTPTPTEVAPPVAGAAPIAYGDPAVLATPATHADFAILYVPRFGADFKRTVAEGVDPQTVLNKGGAGHYEESQMPGAVGNFAVAAHRDGWGSAFIKINELQIGDPIYVETQDGWYTYRYRDTEYVTPYGIGVIDPIPQVKGGTAVDRLITLTSCNPLYIASERIIAYGVFESWQPRSAGAPAEITSVVGSGN